MPPPTLLTIAGFDPSSGAGVTADLMTFAAHGCFGISSITALTVQSTVGVEAFQPVESGLLTQQLRYLTQDLPPSGIKIGMLATAGNVRAVSALLREWRAAIPGLKVVLDPVILSSSGAVLLDGAGVEDLQKLLPLVDFATPNRRELARLLGRPVSGAATVEESGRELAGRYPGLSVVVTGGDEHTPDDLLVSPDGEMLWLRGAHITSRATHGTGCAFSSSLLCHLVQGASAGPAARAAKEYVAQAMRSAVPRGHGNGPLELLWPLLPQTR